MFSGTWAHFLWYPPSPLSKETSGSAGASTAGCSDYSKENCVVINVLNVEILINQSTKTLNMNN